MISRFEGHSEGIVAAPEFIVFDEPNVRSDFPCFIKQMSAKAGVTSAKVLKQCRQRITVSSELPCSNQIGQDTWQFQSDIIFAQWNVSTQSTFGRPWVSSCQWSPPSMLANTCPADVPKYTPKSLP